VTWFGEHPEIVGLLVALFGAGGAGAILLRWLLRDRDKKSVELPPPRRTGNIDSRAKGGGVSVVNIGEGSVSVERGETASPQLLQAWGTRGLAGTDFATLWRAAEHARLTNRQMEEIALDLSNEREVGALRNAVSQRDIETAAGQLRALAERAANVTRSN
jgi:hypothetical protein